MDYQWFIDDLETITTAGQILSHLTFRAIFRVPRKIKVVPGCHDDVSIIMYRCPTVLSILELVYIHRRYGLIWCKAGIPYHMEPENCYPLVI